MCLFISEYDRVNFFVDLYAYGVLQGDQSFYGDDKVVSMKLKEELKLFSSNVASIYVSMRSEFSI